MLVVRGTVATVGADREIIDVGAVAIDGDVIAAVGSFADLSAAFPAAEVRGRPSDLIVPGFVNGHQHLTGDRLVQSSIPDNLAPGEAIFSWAVPVHAHHSAELDELSATLTLAESLRNGITSTFEAGTVAHPERLAAAARSLGARLTLGTWGWDVEDAPFAAPVDEVIDRQRAMLDLADPSPVDRVQAWVSLVGHDLMSDELVVAASDLARERNVGLTFHLSPSKSDPAGYLARTGQRPLVHLDRLGALGSHVAIAHGVHLDDAEVNVVVERGCAVVSCPWAYLRLGQGITDEFRHLQLWRDGGRLALGCDAENAGDMVDGLRTAALFAGLAKDTAIDPTVFGAHEALELLTVKGAGALGVDSHLGSLEPGKQADLVVLDRRRLEWTPTSPDPVLQLVWGSDGRSVSDVYVAGRRVVADGEVTGVDLEALRVEAAHAGARLRADAELPDPRRWPHR